MLKLAPPITLCAIALLQSCSSQPPAPRVAAVAGGEVGKRTGTGMDSPIVVSDDSHLRHKGANGDFVVTYNGGEQINAYPDSGNAILYIQCSGMSPVSGPSNPADDCTSANSGKGATPSNSGWQIDVYSGLGATGSDLMTLKSIPSTSSSGPCLPNTACGVTTNLNGNRIDPEQDNSGDSDVGKGGGTDLTEYDGKGNMLNFLSATFNNGGDTMTLNCSKPNPPNINDHSCKIKIKYK